MFCIMLKEITSEELLSNKKINWPTQLIDIREPYEYEEGYIEGSINIPMGDFNRISPHTT
jgi:rhodanese-related sulfurtransferase